MSSRQERFLPFRFLKCVGVMPVTFLNWLEIGHIRIIIVKPGAQVYRKVIGQRFFAMVYYRNDGILDSLD
jgi:hypothetical protein